MNQSLFRSRLFVLIILFCSYAGISRAQSWAWGRGCKLYDTTYCSAGSNNIAVDGDGNIYQFLAVEADSAEFGTSLIVLRTDTVVSGVVVKYDSSGNLLWTKLVNGCEPYCINVDKANNVYICGIFGDTVTIDGIVLPPIGTPHNYFIAKMNPSGGIIWTNSNRTNGDTRIAIDDSCNVYVSGSYSGTLHFGTDSITAPVAATNFIAKFDSADNYKWSKSLSGYGVGSTSMSVDKDRNIFLAGSFTNTIYFAGDTLRNSHIWIDIAIFKFNASGSPEWGRVIPINDIDHPYLYNDASGNLYVIGTFSIGGLVFGSDTLTSAGSLDMFLAKYSPSGTALWGISAGGSDLDYGTDITIDPLGNLWVTGGTRSTLFEIDTMSMICDISTNGSTYLAELDTNGHPLLMTSFRTGQYNMMAKVASDHKGNMYISGNYMNGNCIVASDTLMRANAGTHVLGDEVLAKFGYERNIVVPTLGITSPEDKFLMYPNPATQQCTVAYRGDITAGASILVMNMEGQVVSRHPMSETTVISTATLSPGIYLCRIENNGVVMVRKLIIE